MKLGGYITYDYEYDALGNWISKSKPAGPKWLRNLLGDDFFNTVVSVVFMGKSGADRVEFGDRDLEKLIAALPKLRTLQLRDTRVTNAGLSCLKQAKTIKILALSRPKTSEH